MLRPDFMVFYEVGSALYSKTFSALLFLDIKKGFDSVLHKILLKKLEHYGVRETANLLLESYLSERKQYV